MKILAISTVSGGAGRVKVHEHTAVEFVQALTHKNYVGRDHSTDGVFIFTETNSGLPKGVYQVVVLDKVIDVTVSDA